MAKRQNTTQEENGFLEIWPADDEFSREEEPNSDQHDQQEDADSPGATNESEQPAEIVVIPDKPTELKGSKNRIVKVLFQGAGDYSGNQAKQRKPMFTEGLTRDQVDIVNNQIINLEKGVVDRAINTDKVIIIDKHTNINELVSTPKTTRTVATQTEEVPFLTSQFLQVPSQITEILRVVNLINTRIPVRNSSSNQSLPDIDILDYVSGSPGTQSSSFAALLSSLSPAQPPSSDLSSSPVADPELPALSTRRRPTPTVTLPDQRPSTSAETQYSTLQPRPSYSPVLPSSPDTPDNQSSGFQTANSTLSPSAETPYEFPICPSSLDSPDKLTSCFQTANTPSSSQHSETTIPRRSDSTPQQPNTQRLTHVTVPQFTTSQRSVSPVPDSQRTVFPVPDSQRSVSPVPDRHHSSSPVQLTSTSNSCSYSHLSGLYKAPTAGYPGPIQEVRSGADIQSNIQELRVHQDTVSRVKDSVTLTASSYGT